MQSIRFVCLAMTDSFIDAHTDDIKNHASDIETRLYDVDFTSGSLKEDNHYYINGFAQYGEQVMLYEKSSIHYSRRYIDAELWQQDGKFC